MHVCFHGGVVCAGGSGRAAKSINVIRDYTKILIGRVGGYHARGRRRQMRRCKDNSGTAAAVAASAFDKIAPAQLHEEEGEEVDGEGKKQEFCDKCCSALLEAGGAEEEAATTAVAESDPEWVAEPDPGVLLTLAPRPDGVTNCLRRIRFREELFDAWAAQCWWADNHDRIAELYSLVHPEDDNEDDEAAAAEKMLPATPCQSEEDEGDAGAESSISRSPSTSTSTFSVCPSSGSSGGESAGTLGSPILGLITAPNTNTGAAAAVADHDGDQQPATVAWREWVEEYDPGVFITVRSYPGHRLQLRCVELSREMFGEVKARVWWEENKARLHLLYSF